MLFSFPTFDLNYFHWRAFHWNPMLGVGARAVSQLHVCVLLFHQEETRLLIYALIIMLHVLHFDALGPHSCQTNEAALQRNPKILNNKKILEQPGKQTVAESRPSIGRPWVQPLVARPSTSPTHPHHQNQLFKILQQRLCYHRNCFSISLRVEVSYWRLKGVKSRCSPSLASRQLWNIGSQGTDWGLDEVRARGGHFLFTPFPDRTELAKALNFTAESGEPSQALVPSPITRTNLTRWSKRETKPQAPDPRMRLEPHHAISAIGSQPPEVYSILWKWAREKACGQASLSKGQSRLKRFRLLLGYFRNYWPCPLQKCKNWLFLPQPPTQKIYLESQTFYSGWVEFVFIPWFSGLPIWGENRGYTPF